MLQSTYTPPSPNPTPQPASSSFMQNLSDFVNIAGNASNVYWGFTNNPGQNPYVNQGGGMSAYMPGGYASSGSSGGKTLLILGGVLAAGVAVVMLTKKK
jgi:hypothetical protein